MTRLIYSTNIFIKNLSKDQFAQNHKMGLIYYVIETERFLKYVRPFFKMHEIVKKSCSRLKTSAKLYIVKTHLRRDTLQPCRWPLYLFSAANEYYSSAGHYEQKNKKSTGQIKFLAVTLKQRIKLDLQHSLCKNEFNVLVPVTPLHSFFYSISCLVK